MGNLTASAASDPNPDSALVEKIRGLLAREEQPCRELSGEIAKVLVDLIQCGQLPKSGPDYSVLLPTVLGRVLDLLAEFDLRLQFKPWLADVVRFAGIECLFDWWDKPDGLGDLRSIVDRMLRRPLPSNLDRDDVTQLVLDRLDGSSKLRTAFPFSSTPTFPCVMRWLWVTVSRVMIDWQRGRIRRDNNLRAFADETRFRCAGPPTGLSECDLKRAIDRIAQLLAPELLAVFLLQFEGDTREEIAHRLNLPIHTVIHRLHNARQTLRTDPIIRELLLTTRRGA